MTQPLADIARDFRRADNLACGVAHRRNGNLDMDGFAITAAAHRLEPIDAFAGPQPADDVSFFVEPVLGDDERNGLADSLGGGEPEQLLGSRIPAGDDAVERFAEDSVAGIVDHRGKPQTGVELESYIVEWLMAPHSRTARWPFEKGRDGPRVESQRRASRGH